jgi:heat shock protein HspQ
MSWSSPANPPTKTTAAPKAHLVHENPKERHHSYVMEFDTTDEEVGEAW